MTDARFTATLLAGIMLGAGAATLVAVTITAKEAITASDGSADQRVYEEPPRNGPSECFDRGSVVVLAPDGDTWLCFEPNARICVPEGWTWTAKKGVSAVLLPCNEKKGKNADK